MSSNLHDFLVSRFPADRSRPCMLLPGGGVVTWAEVEDGAARIAAALLARGVNPGDHVVMQAPKCPEVAMLWLGILRAGAVLVPLNTAYTGAEVAAFLEDCSPSLVIRDVAAFAAGASSHAPLRTAVHREGDDVAALVYTSGTTGRSKGAMLSHGNLASNAEALATAWGFTPDDVLLHALPVFHVHGLFIAMHCALASGSTMLWLPRFEEGAVLEALPRATVMMGVPTFYTRLLADPRFDRRVTRDVRLFVSGSAPLLPSTFAAFEERTGQRILERYGMSEALVLTTNPLDGERLAGSVGHPLPGLELRIGGAGAGMMQEARADAGTEKARADAGTEEARADAGTEEARADAGTEEARVDTGAAPAARRDRVDFAVPDARGPGVVEVRGPGVFGGYHGRPRRGAPDFTADGWFVTGDIGRLDADGRLWLVGRAKDLVISGGFNVYPKEVEAVLDEVDGVVESAVIGVPHADWGEAVVAVVEGVAAEAEVIAAARAVLAAFKVPKRVFVVDALPRNAMGKVLKNALRERFAGAFAAGLDDAG